MLFYVFGLILYFLNLLTLKFVFPFFVLLKKFLGPKCFGLFFIDIKDLFLVRFNGNTFLTTPLRTFQVGCILTYRFGEISSFSFEKNYFHIHWKKKFSFSQKFLLIFKKCTN